MRVLRGQEFHPKLSAQQFMDSFKDLELELLAGSAGLGREIGNPRIQKPGLGLAGDPEYIHPDRIQILGATEINYLSRHGGPDQRQALETVLKRGVCLFLVTKGLTPTPALVEVANATNTPLIRSPKTSSYVISVVTDRLLDMMAPRLTTHGSFLDVYGVGLLLVGESSVGKSESALDLVVRGHRLVSDDIVEIRRRGEILVGRAPEMLQYHMELRGVGIVNIKDLFGVVATQAQKEVDLVVELEAWREGRSYDRLGVDDPQTSILGVACPYLLLPVAPARNITILLEVAVRNLLLKRKGINSARAFARLHMERMGSQKDEP
ncbi:MAG: HPr(Ser) kinase/phosphatase [Acidobacteria bacterium]|nr:HPr(Ser) kinase/phosphatase [Acidobacteriota bacterium]